MAHDRHCRDDVRPPAAADSPQNASTPFAPARSGARGAAAVGTTATRIGRPERDRPLRGTGHSRAARNPLVTGQELPAPVERDRPAHSGSNPVGRRHVLDRRLRRLVAPGRGPRPRPRATIRDSRPGATTNGARYAMSRIGTGTAPRPAARPGRTRAPRGRRRTRRWSGSEPGQLEPPRRQQDDQSEDETDGQESGGRQHDSTMVGPRSGRRVSGSSSGSAGRRAARRPTRMTTTQIERHEDRIRRTARLPPRATGSGCPTARAARRQGAGRVPLGDRLEPGRQRRDRDEDVRDERDREDDRERHLLGDLDGRHRQAEPDADPDHREGEQEQQPDALRAATTMPVWTVQPTTKPATISTTRMPAL